MLKECEVVLPAGEGSKLKETELNKQVHTNITARVAEAITSDVVPDLVSDDVGELTCPNYVIDISNHTTISVMSKMAINSLLRDDGDCQIVLYKKGVGLAVQGKGFENEIETALPVLLSQLYSKDVKLYKNVVLGQALPKEVPLGKQLKTRFKI